MDTNYKIIVNSVAFASKQLREQRKTATKARKKDIIIKLHTLMVTQWIGATRCNIDRTRLEMEIKGYYKSQHIKTFDELYFLKHYRFGYADFLKYKKEFEDRMKYKLNII